MTTSKEMKKDANVQMKELIKVGQTVFGIDTQILLNEIFQYQFDFSINIPIQKYNIVPKVYYQVTRK